jgi:hypothetical protein
MAFAVENLNRRPFSADVSLRKPRPFSSNCPTIVKHNIAPLNEDLQTFVDPSQIKMPRERPRTALSNKNKFVFGGAIAPRNFLSPTSAGTFRPSTAPLNSFVNFDFINSIGKSKNPKFEDKSGIRPLKKINTVNFHTVIYKVKQQKEAIEQKIADLEQWQKDIKTQNVWSTPQSAIVNNILEMNAKSNPDGVINEYLRQERDKAVQEKMKRQSQRPGSASGGLFSRTVGNAKSVTDFFKDYTAHDIMNDILNSPSGTQSTRFPKGKKDITEKINDYLDNMNNYRTLVSESKEIITSHYFQNEKLDSYKTAPVEEVVELEEEHFYHRPLDISTGRDPKSYTIPGIAITKGDSNTTSREYNGLGSTKSTISPKGVLVKNSRPSTAKKNAASTPNLLTKEMGFLKNKGKFFADFNSPKESFGLQGEKVTIQSFNELGPKSAKSVKKLSEDSSEHSLEQQIADFRQQYHKARPNVPTVNTGVLRPSTAAQKKAKILFRPMSAKESTMRNRLNSAKSGKSDNNATHGSVGTHIDHHQPAPAINNIYIDGEYFDAYSHQVVPSTINIQKSVIKSWITHERQSDKNNETEHSEL